MAGAQNSRMNWRQIPQGGMGWMTSLRRRDQVIKRAPSASDRTWSPRARRTSAFPRSARDRGRIRFFQDLFWFAKEREAYDRLYERGALGAYRSACRYRFADVRRGQGCQPSEDVERSDYAQYEASSMFAPVTMRPSGVSSAAPTRNLEYGLYARALAVRARSIVKSGNVYQCGHTHAVEDV